MKLLDRHYLELTVTITSADPLYVTTAVKCMLRRKNRLVQSGRLLAAAAAISVKIGDAIKQFSNAELCRADVLADARTTWTKVQQLTGQDEANSEQRGLQCGYSWLAKRSLSSHFR